MPFAARCRRLALPIVLALAVAVAGPGHARSASHAPELVLQTGHTAAVQSVAFSPDGRWIATGGYDQAVKVWDVATGHELRSFAGHGFFVNAVAVSPDGRLLASSSHDLTVRLWHVASGRAVHVMPGHAKPVLAVAFSLDGRWLASGSTDETIRVWDVATGRQTKVLTGHKMIVSALAFSPDGARLVAGGWHGALAVWDLATDQPPQRLVGHRATVHAVAWRRDGTLLATAGGDGTVRLWDGRSGHPERVLQGHTDSVNAVALSGDGRRLASASADRTVRVWDLASGRELRVLSGHGWAVNGVAFSPDGGTLASASDDHTARLWHLDSGREVRTFGGHSFGVKAAAFSRDARWLAAASLDHSVKLWELATGQQLPPLAAHREQVWGVDWSRDGRWLVSSSRDGIVKLWEPSTWREARTLGGHRDAVTSVAFNRDATLLATGSADHTVKLWDPRTGRELATLAGAEFVWSVAFSPDGRWLARATVGRNRPPADALAVEEFAPPQLVRALTAGSWTVAFHPAGGRLASDGGRNHAIELWDTTTRRRSATLAGHRGHVQALAYSPDGRWLASASSDATVKLWDSASGHEVRTLAGHSAEVSGVAFDPEGRWLASTSADGSTKLWDPATGELLASLVSLREGDEWIVVAPDGLFDGSPAAWSRILWRFGGDTFDASPIETFFNEFYHPGLLGDLLSGKRPRAPRDLSRLDRRQPRVTLGLAPGAGAAGATVATRTVRVRVEVAEAPADRQRRRGGGARDVRLFRNGSLVKLWRGDVVAAGRGKVVLEAAIPIVAGDNRLTAYAFNRDNIKSADATLTVTGAEALERERTAIILAIGINEYANRRYNLRYAVADARAFGAELQTQLARLGGFARIEVVSLLDREATRSNIAAALARLAGGRLPPGAPPSLTRLPAARPEDTVIVYFAGHGLADGPRFYLLPHDLGYRGSLAAVDERGRRALIAHGISDVDLERAFERTDAGRLLFVIDACNSGQALEADEKRRGPMNSRGLAQLAYEKGMYVLAAAQGYQAANEAEKFGHGLLTYALVQEGLRTPAADRQPRDGVIWLREWLDYATVRVPQLQVEVMNERGGRGREVAFVDGEESREIDKRSLQHPKVFYRREPEPRPLVVARPEGPARD